MSETQTAPAPETPETETTAPATPETVPATTEAPTGSEAGSESSSAAPATPETPAPAPGGKRPYRVKHVKLDFRGQRLRKGDVVLLTETEFKSFPSHFEE